MARCPAHGNRIQLNPSRAVNLFGATPQTDCRRTSPCALRGQSGAYELRTASKPCCAGSGDQLAENLIVLSLLLMACDCPENC